MNLLHRFLTVFLFLSLLFSCSAPDRGVRSVIDFDQHWKFKTGEFPGVRDTTFSDKNWRELNLPHDWSIEGPFAENNPAGFNGGALPGGMGCYRKSFALSPDHREKKITIVFDGVYRNSEVWINGHFLGKRPNGYITFHYDITPFVHFTGNNIMVVKADNSQQPNSRWYSGSGIYRHVRLLITDKVYLSPWETFITTPRAETTKAQIVLRLKILNTSEKDASITITTRILDRDKNQIAEFSDDKHIPHDSSLVFSREQEIKSPALWSVDHPDLYTAVSSISLSGKVIDEQTQSFGVRYFNFDVDKGFSLNGEPMKIRGVCLHHDLGCLGTAVNTRAMERQLEIMKAMGVNGLRTTHNPPAPELLDLCDKMGFIVMDESFDIWKKEKNKYDYHLDWDQWHKRDLEDQVIRDRNHPSVIIWSIGNEVREQGDPADSSSVALTRELAGIVRNLDPTRPITAACDHIGKDNPLIHSGALDLVGLNYHHEYYAAFQKDHPGKKFISTESTSALETRGYYDMPSDSIRRWPVAWDKPFNEGNPDNTVSAYDNVSAPWGSTHEETWKVMKKYDFLSGMFLWTGFDYIGEPTPYGWPSRSSYFGVVDLAGFPKDSYYMYQSEWTNKPVLHLFPHWNWKPGKIIDVWAYYNQADEVELFLNDKSLGIRKKQGDDLHVFWRIAFEAGTLRAVSRKDGKEVLREEIKTAGVATKIVAVADRSLLKADGKDLCFVSVSLTDDNGTLVPDANNLLKFELKGEGTLAGADNGNPVDHDSFQTPEHRAFNGRCLIVIRSKDAAGKISLRIRGEGLRRGSVAVDVR